jgi:hypothetical protein
VKSGEIGFRKGGANEKPCKDEFEKDKEKNEKYN